MTVPGKGGRPLKFESPEELSEKLETYYADCEKRDVPITVAGMCVALECDRRTLLNYQNSDKFFHIVKKAKDKVRQVLEERMLGDKNPAGAIFLTKANYGYSDKSQIELSGDFNIIFDEQDKGLCGE